MRALIVRLSAIGDVVHTLPALAALRGHGWEVDWAVEPAARPLLEGHPMLSQVAAVPGARGLGLGAARRTLRALQAREYDVALDFQGLWKSALWARLAHASRLVGYSRAWRREPLSSFLVREPVDQPAGVSHVIDKNLALLRPLGIDAVGSREFPLPLWPKQARAAQTDLGDLGLTEFVVLNPGGGWAGKLWPVEGYAAVARGLADRGLRALVTWGPGEERLAERVVAVSGGAATKCFPTSLVEYVELARRARLVVAADTGPMHLACAIGTPVVGIYGPTDPARNGPFSPKDAVVRRKPLCSPCHRRRCATHDGVMAAIAPQEVLLAIDRRLGLTSGTKSIAV